MCMEVAVMHFNILVIGSLKLKLKEFADQFIPLDPECQCSTCKNYTRSLLHVMFKETNALASQLLTCHNISYMMRLMRSMRQAILDGPEAYINYVNRFLALQYPNNDVPSWVVSALDVAGVPVRI